LLTFAIVGVYFVGTLLPAAKDLSPKEIRNSLSWRIAIAVPAFLSIIQTILLCAVYRTDSPAYYASKGNWDEAKAALEQIYTDESDADTKLQDIKTAYNKAGTSSAVPK